MSEVILSESTKDYNSNAKFDTLTTQARGQKMRIYHQRNKIPTDWQLIETHAHSLPVSQCSELEYKELLDIYADNYYNGIFITDHYNVDFELTPYYQSNIGISDLYANFSKYAQKKGLNALFGLELKFNPRIPDPYQDSEFLIYGCEPQFLDKYPYIYNCDTVASGLCTLKNLLSKEYGNSFLIIQAHPQRNRKGILHNRNIDGIELYNGTERALTRLYTKLTFSGSDAHLPEHCCNNAILLRNWNGTKEDFIHKIKKRQYALYANTLSSTCTSI